jgi:hypothetical protein
MDKVPKNKTEEIMLEIRTRVAARKKVTKLDLTALRKAYDLIDLFITTPELYDKSVKLSKIQSGQIVNIRKSLKKAIEVLDLTQKI